jgi:predicted NBD/HSP70 family sugar kinase
MALANLQAATQVSLPTLRGELRDLIQTGWVRRVGCTSTRGRPATLYGINGETHLLLGVHLELPALNVVLTSLKGEVLRSMHFADEEPLPPDVAIQQIANFIRELQTAYSPRRILGVGVATPGFVDPESGEILSIDRTPGWRHFPLKTRFRAALTLPVVVENDIDCMAFAELEQGQVLSADNNMVYLGVSEGIKVSLWLGGKLYKGPFGNVGIIGRTIVPDARKGGGQYLEAIVSVGRICTTFDNEVASLAAPAAQLMEMRAMKDRGQKFQAILEAAAHEDPLCRRVITEALDALAVATSNLIYLFQPRLLVIGGALSNLPAPIRSSFEHTIRRHLPTIVNNHLVIKYASLTGDNVAAVGAAYGFLHQYLIDDLVVDNSTLPLQR